MSDIMNALEERQQVLAEDAQVEGAALIREKLRALEARFPRHRFRYLDGMGTMSVECLPAIFGDHRKGFTILSHLQRHAGDGMAARIRNELIDAADDITDTAARIGDQFKIDFGEVTTADNDEPAAVTPAERMAAAIEALGLSIRCEFVPFSQSRNKGEAQPSLNWFVIVERSGREVLTTDYMQGSGHAPAYKKTWAGGNSHVKARAIALECETGRIAKPQMGQGEPFQSRHPIDPPAAHEVIWSLSRDADVLDYSGFEEWADNMGYDADSRKGEAIHRACLEIALKLRAAIGESGIEALRVAGEDY